MMTLGERIRYVLLPWLRSPVTRTCVAWLSWRGVPTMLNFRVEQPLHVESVTHGHFGNLVVNLRDGSEPIVLREAWSK